METTALDPHPRRCLFCGTTIHLCMGFCLARDVIVLWKLNSEFAHNQQGFFTAMYARGIKVRELCGKCIFAWDRIAEKAEAERNQWAQPSR